MTQPQQLPTYEQTSPYGTTASGHTANPTRPPLSPQHKALRVVGGALGIFLITILVLGMTTTNPRSVDVRAHTFGQTADAPHLSGSTFDKEIKAIKQTIAGMAQAAKANDFTKMLTFFCAKYRKAFGDIAGSGQAPDLNALTKSANGPSKITGLDIIGDVAVIHMADAKGKHDVEFTKETTGWKFCPKA